MDKFLSDLPLFIAVAKHKSFTAAADELDIPVSTASRRISALEKRMGIPLLLRNSRHVELTAAGRECLERGSFILEEARDTLETVTRNASTPSGWVRVALSAEIYYGYMRGSMKEFTERYPDIRLNLSMVSHRPDLLTEPYDIAMMVGKLPDSALRVRKLRSIPSGVYASEELFKDRPLPEKPADLSNIPFVSFSFMPTSWWMYSKGKKAQVKVHPAHLVNSAGLAYDFALSGLGAAILPTVMTNTPGARSRLTRPIRLLPEWSTPSVDINAVMPATELPKRARVFVEYLAEYFKAIPD
ncbi:LysR family transcriptional regulator [Desulfovibrio sp. OttesenSCG-928-I05]|nr:LysR family transcriptional regulator [Desulfovibrio sp. OttesenSCG-928-I05]